MMRWFGISVFVVVLDQFTKQLADSKLVFAQAVAVLPSFNLTLLYNKGAAFSFLSDASGWQRWFFVTLSSVASVLLVVWILKLKPHQRVLAVALALILGGAVGNLIDRLLLGHVIDFIQLYYGTFYWPAFNIADSAITIGAVLLVWESLFDKSKAA